MWIWTLYHSSVVGYVIFFGLFLDCAVTLFNSKSSTAEWLKWLFWGVLILIVGYLNPSFSHPLEVMMSPPEWKSIIQEYMPTTRAYGQVIYGVLGIGANGAIDTSAGNQTT